MAVCQNISEKGLRSFSLRNEGKCMDLGVPLCVVVTVVVLKFHIPHPLGKKEKRKVFIKAPAVLDKDLLTLIAPNKICSRRHLNFLLLSFEENKA